MTSRSSQQGERGAAALSLLTVGLIIAFAIVAVMSIPLTQASDAKAKSNSAADAAALAGVEIIKGDLENALATYGWLGGWEDYQEYLGSGLDAAQSFARRNEAQLISYDPPTVFNGWTAHAEVKGRTVKGEVFTSGATAQLDLPDCTIEDADTEVDVDPDAEVGADPVVKHVDCGGLQVDVEVDEDGPIKFELPDSFIAKLIGESHAKLVD